MSSWEAASELEQEQQAPRGSLADAVPMLGSRGVLQGDSAGRMEQPGKSAALSGVPQASVSPSVLS